MYTIIKTSGAGSASPSIHWNFNIFESGYLAGIQRSALFPVKGKKYGFHLRQGMNIA
jgi:hypothetical protein